MQEKTVCVTDVSHVGRAGTAASAMSEKVRTRLEELDDFEEVSRPLVRHNERGTLQPFCQVMPDWVAVPCARPPVP